MEGDDLVAEEVVAWRDAGRNVEVGPAAAGDDAVNTPFTAAVETILSDLEPLEARGACRRCVVYLGAERCKFIAGRVVLQRLTGR